MFTKGKACMRFAQIAASPKNQSALFIGEYLFSSLTAFWKKNLSYNVLVKMNTSPPEPHRPEPRRSSVPERRSANDESSALPEASRLQSVSLAGNFRPF